MPATKRPLTQPLPVDRHRAHVASLPRLWPLKDYRGDVRIEEHPNGCLIVWTVSCKPRIPGLEKRLESTVRSTYTRIAAALARESRATGDLANDLLSVRTSRLPGLIAAMSVPSCARRVWNGPIERPAGPIWA